MKPKTIKFLSSFLGVIIVLLLISGCALNVVSSQEKSEEKPLTFPSRIEKPKLVPVEFQVELKRSYSPDAVMALEVLDDISGLDRNITRYELIKISENKYGATLMLPLSGNIKYRYLSTFPINQPEVAADGSAVIFRTMTVSENLHIHDIIAGWPELPYDGEKGILTGIISDKQTEQPLADILVTVAGYQTFTDMTGRFNFENIPVGVQKVSAISIDGSYLSFQQEANIMPQLSTPAVIQMTKLPEVNITFIVSAPKEADGAPLRMAGNLYQLGNSYADLGNGVSSIASRMPILSRTEEGKYTLQMKLHAGNDFIYRYTLGDGWFNAERNKDGDLVTRHFIVPDKDLTVKDEIYSWGENNAEPINIKVNVPADTPTEDSISIQFKQEIWQQPIPMWPMGNNQWMYVAFCNPSAVDSIQFRICRNDQCEIAYDEASFSAPIALNSANSNSIEYTVKAWHVWSGHAEDASNLSDTLDTNKLQGVEFTSNYQPSDLNRYRNIFAELKQDGFNWVIFTPSWKVSISNGIPRLSPNPGKSMLIMDLENLVKLAKENGFLVGLNPRLDFNTDSSDWWQNTQRDAIWWQEWYKEYELFVINYTQFAAKNEVDQLILGGVDINASLPGALITTATNKGTPKNADTLWSDLLQKVQQYFQGTLLWALPIDGNGIPSYDFYDQLDGFYLQFQSPLEESTYYDENTVKDYADKLQADFQSRYSQSEFYVGLNAPSLLPGVLSCNSGDCLINARDLQFDLSSIDLESQSYFYQVYWSTFSQYDWIKGLSSRGFFPVVKLLDCSSSIYGKPTMQWITSNNFIPK